MEFPRAAPSGIAQTSLGFREHLITNFPHIVVLRCPSEKLGIALCSVRCFEFVSLSVCQFVSLSVCQFVSLCGIISL